MPEPTKPDLEIITRPGRTWASLVANTVDGYRHIGASYMQIPIANVMDIADGIRATNLTLQVWDCCPSFHVRPAPLDFS
jgi:hypothetical protein